MCILPTVEGRIALVNDVLTRTTAEERDEEPALLRELFGVVLD